MSPMNGSNTVNNPAMATATTDMENQSYYRPAGQPWQKEDYPVILRGLALVTSFISFIVMVRNNHGYTTDGLLNYSNNYGDYDVYRYLLAVAIIATVYNLSQLLRRFCNGKPMFTPRGLLWLDFSGDQIMAYLLMSGASSAVQSVRDQKSSGVMLNSFTESSAASMSMAFLAFLPMALSAIISAFKLSS